ncbi:MAG: hypothetical protein Q7S87_07085 [Agitococcus sp.]|nr:hypothetical protein [Agitococcus sp.]
MTTPTKKSFNLSSIRWTAICYLQPAPTAPDDIYKSATHVVGIFFRSESEAKNAALNYFNHHPCISYMVYQQAIECAVNEAQAAHDTRITAAAVSADIGLSNGEVNRA